MAKTVLEAASEVLLSAFPWGTDMESLLDLGWRSYGKDQLVNDVQVKLSSDHVNTCIGNQNAGYTVKWSDDRGLFQREAALNAACPNFTGPEERCNFGGLDETKYINCFELGNVTSFSFVRKDMAQQISSGRKTATPFKYLIGSSFGQFCIFYDNTNQTRNDELIFCSYPTDGGTGYTARPNAIAEKLPLGCCQPGGTLANEQKYPSFLPDQKKWSDEIVTGSPGKHSGKTMLEVFQDTLSYTEVVIKTWNNNAKGARGKGMGETPAEQMLQWGWSDLQGRPWLAEPPVLGYGIMTEGPITTKDTLYQQIQPYVNTGKYPIVGIDLLADGKEALVYEILSG